MADDDDIGSIKEDIPASMVKRSPKTGQWQVGSCEKGQVRGKATQGEARFNPRKKTGRRERVSKHWPECIVAENKKSDFG